MSMEDSKGNDAFGSNTNTSQKLSRWVKSEAQIDPWLAIDLYPTIKMIAEPFVGAETPANGAATKDILTRTEWKILRVLESSGAHTSETCLTQPEIARRAHIGEHKSNGNATSFKRLREFGLTTASQNTGTWLTAKGAQLLRDFPAG
jgi:hypothetical protein